MSIQTKLFAIFLVFIMLPIVCAEAYFFRHARTTLMESRTAQFVGLAELRKNKVESYFHECARDLDLFSKDGVVEANLPILSRPSDGKESPAYRLAKANIDHRVKEVLSVSRYADVVLTDADGVIVYTGRKGQKGVTGGRLPDPGSAAFREGRKGRFFTGVFRDPSNGNRPGMLTVAPVSGKDGRYAGVAAFVLDMGPIYEAVQDTAGLGETGETLIGCKDDNSVLFLNNLRFDPNAALTRRVAIGGPLGAPVQRAVAGGHGVGTLKDYRGKEVLAAWEYIPSPGWGMVAKMDVSEAFASVERLWYMSVILGFAVLMSAFAAAYLISRTITGPVSALRRGADIIGSGNLDHKVGTSSKDEVGQLTRAFDRMTANLKTVTASRDELEKEVAERKKAEDALRASQNFLMTIIETEPECVKLIGLDGKLQMMNRSGLDMIEVESLDQVKGLPVSGLIAPEDLDAFNALGEKVFNGGAGTLEFGMIGAKGRRLRLETHAVPLRDEKGEITALLGITRDVTEKRKSEEALKETLDELTRSNKELEQFAYVASHDLQEPLRMVASYLQLIARRYRERLDPDADEFIGFAVDGATRMQKMINDLLALSRVGTRGKPFLPTDSGEALANALRDLGVAIEESGATVTHDPLPTVDADESQLTLLFQNLIGNAVKFRGDRPPRIHVSARREEDGWVFAVRDNGVGIDPQYFERVFVIFQRLQAGGMSKGTGIGLAICKKIVERHGGRIWVESAPDEGATFCFTLPLTKGGLA